MLLSRRGHADRTGRFRSWRSARPFWGSVLVIVAGVELFFSGQLDIGQIHLQFGVEGMQGVILPAALVVLGILAMLSPAQRMFYGIVGLIIAVYSLIGVNLGGFFVGFLLGVVGGVLVVAWSPQHPVVAEAEAVVAEAAAQPQPALAQPPGAHAEPALASTAAAEAVATGPAHAEYVPYELATRGARHEGS